MTVIPSVLSVVGGLVTPCKVNDNWSPLLYPFGNAFFMVTIWSYDTMTYADCFMFPLTWLNTAPIGTTICVGNTSLITPELLKLSWGSRLNE